MVEHEPELFGARRAKSSTDPRTHSDETRGLPCEREPWCERLSISRVRLESRAGHDRERTELVSELSVQRRDAEALGEHLWAFSGLGSYGRARRPRDVLL